MAQPYDLIVFVVALQTILITVILSYTIIHINSIDQYSIPVKSYILNQIPNATSNTYLNNSKATKCRLIPFKLCLNKCLRRSIFEFERSA